MMCNSVELSSYMSNDEGLVLVSKYDTSILRYK